MFGRIAQSILCLALIALSVRAQTQITPGQQEQPGKTSIIIERQLVRFTTQGEPVEWRLTVTSQHGVLVFDSGLVFGNALEWPLLNYEGQALESGLYAYTLTTKAVNEAAARTQQGHLIVDRASSADRLWLTSTQPVGLGADSSAPQVTVSGSPEATVGGAELPGGVPRRESSGERAVPQRDTQGQRAEDGSRAASAGPKATLATANRLVKFADGAGNLTDSGVLETFVNGGLVQTFGNTPPTSAAFNHVVEIVAGSGKTPLTLVGGAGAMEFWRNDTPSSAVAFGVAKPATPAVATDDMVFSAYKQSDGVWFERMRLTNGGNLGIGTANPGAKLDVAGAINAKAQYNLDGFRVLGGFAGLGNLFIGFRAGEAALAGIGSSNTIVGVQAGQQTIGRANSFFGRAAGISDKGGFANTAIGSDADVGSDNLINATAIGACALVTQNDSLVLGSTLDGRSFCNGEPLRETKVGIGTTAPTAKLSVIATGDKARVLHLGTERAWVFKQLGTGAETALELTGDDPNNNNKNFVINTTGFVGIGTIAPTATLSVNGTANKPGGGSWGVFSDERLKSIKGPFTAGLNALLQLQPIRYEYLRDNALKLKAEGEHIGFSAQAVQKLIPEAVSTTERGYLMVNNDPILWTMLNAIKEQQAQIQAQAQQIKAQQQQLDALKQRRSAGRRKAKPKP